MVSVHVNRNKYENKNGPAICAWFLGFPDVELRSVSMGGTSPAMQGCFCSDKWIASRDCWQALRECSPMIVILNEPNTTRGKYEGYTAIC
jgi:hypothetical protein